MRNPIRGFTLVELAVVVAIIALLAAFAVPRFTSIENQARVSAIAALSSNIRGASALAHAQWVASGKPPTIEVEGRTITLANGYPDASRSGLASTLQDTVGFSATFTRGAVVYKKAGAPNPERCSIVYSVSPTPTPPRIILVTPDLSGC